MKRSKIVNNVLHIGEHDRKMVEKFLYAHQKEKYSEERLDNCKLEMNALISRFGGHVKKMAVDNTIKVSVVGSSKSSCDLKGLQAKYKKAVAWVVEFTNNTPFISLRVPSKQKLVDPIDQIA